MVKKKTSKIDSKKSRYSKKQDAVEDEIEEPLEDEFEEPIEENFDEYSEDPVQPISSAHQRSRGLFNNIWWKKGLLKGFSVWLAIVIIFYFFEIMGLVEVIDWKRWAFFLVLLVIMGMVYQKYISGKVDL